MMKEQDEINNLDKIHWEEIHENNCHWLMMKPLSIFNAQKSTSSEILCLCLGKDPSTSQNPTKLGRKGLNGSQLIKATEIMTVSMESRLNSSGTSSQDSQRCSSAVKSQIYWAIWEKHQKLSQEEFSSCPMFNDIACDTEGNKEECVTNAKVVTILARKFGIGQWSFLGPDSEKK